LDPGRMTFGSKNKFTNSIVLFPIFNFFCY